MNVVSVVILGVVVLAFIMALRLAFLRRKGRGSSCCSNCMSKDSCLHKDKPTADCTETKKPL